MKKFALLVLVVILASLFVSAPAVAESDKMVVVARLDNVVKVFYTTSGFHHFLVFDGKEYKPVSAYDWLDREMEKAAIWGRWSARYRLPVRFFPSNTGSSYAEAVRIGDRGGVNIFISNSEVFGGSSSQVRVGKSQREEKVEVLK